MPVRKQEAALKSRFAYALKQQLPQFLMFLASTRAVPDRTIVGNGRTTFWEFKHATPDFESPGDQELMCMRIAAQGVHCRYVIFWESSEGLGKKTMIVTPREVHERKSWVLVPEFVTPGFDFKWLVNEVKRAHRV